MRKQYGCVITIWNYGKMDVFSTLDEFAKGYISNTAPVSYQKPAYDMAQGEI